MGFFSSDLESMVELYQREIAGLMEEFDTRLTRAVQDGHFSAEDIRAVFRIVHTIKSSAAMMGLKDISTCTHRMEDLFLLFRDKPELTIGQESRIFDLMYLLSDYVERETGRVSGADFRPESAAPVIAATEKEIAFFAALRTGAKENGTPAVSAGIQPSETHPDGIQQTSASDTASGAVSPADLSVSAAADASAGTSPSEGKSPSGASLPSGSDPHPGGTADTSFLFSWRVRLRAGCQMENVRAFMLLRALQPLCSKILTVPSNLEAPDAAAQISRSGIVFRFSTAHKEDAEKLLLASPYVASVEKDGADAPSGSTVSSAPAGKQQSYTEDTAGGHQNKFSMVSWSHVQNLQNITGELITANTILGNSIRRLGQNGSIDNEFQNMNRLFHELESLVAAVSMMPVSGVIPQYYRLVRDIASKEKKQIRLKVIGEDLEIDRSLLDTLANPLVHLLRNAADHGIETPEERTAKGKDPCGTITLEFENMTDHLRVTVTDDVRGMDTQRLMEKAIERGILTKDPALYTKDEILNLAFHPGLTTNDTANQYSGRGVGMDVAQSVTGSLGGSVTLTSEADQGSSVLMEVPVSMTSAECIRFMVGDYTCLIPIRSVLRIYSLREAGKHIKTIDGQRWFQDKELLPVLDMFGLYHAEADGQQHLILIKDIRGSAALLTGNIAGQQTAVEKPLPELLSRSYRTRCGIIGCAVTDTGRLGMMLNADSLLQICKKEAAENRTAAVNREEETENHGKQQ